ncbi:MAG: hypothetical protein C0467_24630 [Planctomycetaceae bacterium]|nr:hypothetical protein [Planctomycetaceae bacterium]
MSNVTTQPDPKKCDGSGCTKDATRKVVDGLGRTIGHYCDDCKKILFDDIKDHMLAPVKPVKKSP